MAATIACANCGAEGESNFSTNYFGELVCELCGTQSYLQTRTETQDAEDMGLDISALAKMKRRVKRKKRARAANAAHVKTEPRRPVRLFDCIVATQYILNEQAEALVRVGFPPELPRVVRDVWFHFLQVWQAKGARPFLRCFTEFHYQRHAADKAMDPAVTNDVLEQWDAENGSNLERLFSVSQQQHAIPEDDDAGGPTSVPGETKKKITRDWQHTLDWFVLPDMIGLLVLAGRVLNVGALPCDYAHWVQRGDLPYHNVLSLCPVEVQEPVERVAVFFDATIRTNWLSTAVVAYRAHYLQFHLEIHVPPLNAPLVAFNMCENLGLPPQVFRNFQWLSAHFNIAGALPERPIQTSMITRNQDERGSALDSGAGIAAYLLAAIRLCPNWHEWVYERVLRKEQHLPPYSAAEADRLPRRELAAFVEFCEETLLGTDRGRIPEDFVSHVEDLKGPLSGSTAHHFARTYQDHALRAYPPLYEDGICVESPEEIDTRVGLIKQQQLLASHDGEDLKIGVDAAPELKPTLFYPTYGKNGGSVYHAPLEAALELLAEYIDCPMGLVMRWVDMVDRNLRDRATEFVRLANGLTEKKLRRLAKKQAAAAERLARGDVDEDDEEEQIEGDEGEEGDDDDEDDAQRSEAPSASRE